MARWVGSGHRRCGDVPRHRILGRRFRALKLWWVIKSYGVEGIQAIIREHCEWAQQVAGWIGEDERFELMAPVPLALVCFRLRPRAGEDLA